ncbi:Mg2+ transporter protein CorA-like/Zinc transport protein ZntB [Penicillium cf. viridicatum]|uniref:Mg2+ transporter protein CorA-like/Zinc transport protein ZntB n=1 Tax=Penicillium cf. viridicatum TaxID=2972119 RepID=A0A9W9MBR2_9EURO|nr:Mg2+ transporter protein CorA-like/Zinc transport protein ZntB [Penicillium cf. viridicatum]
MEKDGLHGTRGRPDGAKSERFQTILEEDHDMNAMRPLLEWEHTAKNNLRPLFNVFRAVAHPWKSYIGRSFRIDK